LLNSSKPAQRFKPACVKGQPALEAGRQGLAARKGQMLYHLRRNRVSLLQRTITAKASDAVGVGTHLLNYQINQLCPLCLNRRMRFPLRLQRCLPWSETVGERGKAGA